MQVLGIDIGGTGIKGVPVDLETEDYLGERFRVPTPEKATPEAITACVKQIVDQQIDELFGKSIGLPFTVINDADAAGIAEMTYGVGRGKKGLVAVITVGTGIGSGLFYNGNLIPNFELGRLPYKKKPIEHYAANSARKREGLSYEEWAERFNFFLSQVELVCTPDHYILGGGISKHLDVFKHVLTTKIPFEAAKTKNHAGIIGAARAAMLNPDLS